MPFAVPDAVTAVVRECLGAFGDNLRAAVWQGSRARGEATETSDHDLILVFRRLDEGVLLRLRGIFRDRDHWSTVQWSEEEVRQLPADSRLQLAYGFHVLHGEFEPFHPTHEDVVAELRSLAEGIAFQCRYRLIHKRSDMPRQVRMMHYMAKNAILAMKARHLLTAGKVPSHAGRVASFHHGFGGAADHRLG